ncbi:hypothetical protein PZA11_001167 [Diplocarpon coronariae]|nr:hypothetical protein JHW43_004427 [Diplocarpon mali]
MSPSKPTLRERALQTNKTNPSQLGDPISLKAETSSTSPTPSDRGAQSPVKHISKVAPAPTEGDSSREKGGKGGKTLRQRAMDKLHENPSQLGDPVSLKAETADSQPTENDRGAGGKSKL